MVSNTQSRRDYLARVRIRAEVESANVRSKYSKDLKNKMKRNRTKRGKVGLKRETLT